MALPVRYTDHTDHEMLQLTIELTRSLADEVVHRLKTLIDSWFTIGLYSGYGGGPGAGFTAIHDIEYDEEDLWVSWTVDAHHLGTSAVEVLAMVLEDFGSFEAAGSPPLFKELVVGFIVEE